MGALETIPAAFLPWLFKTTLQGSLLVGLILLLKAVLRERLPVRWHYCVWLVLLVRLALPWSPPSRLSIYNVIPRSFSSHQMLSAPAAGAGAEARAAKPGTPEPDGGTGPASGVAQDRAAQAGPGGAAASAPPVVAGQPGDVSAVGRRPWAGLAAAVAPWLWLAGCVVLSTYIFLRAFGLWWVVRSERPVTDQQILDLLEDGKMQMRVRTLVGVVLTDKVRTPALFGFLRPRILLPQGLMETLGPEELRHVFLHELAHLKRRDIYLAWLVCLLQVLHWFNPLIWLAFRRMRADQEMAADALVLATAGADESRRYGQTIIRLLERFSRPQYVPSLAGILENPSHIERRIHMIGRSKSDSRAWSAMGAGLILVFGTVAMIDPIRGAVSAGPASQAKPSVTMRLVQKDIDGLVSMSPDGKYVCSCGAWSERGITVLELATGEQRTIKPTKLIPGETDPEIPILSPDNKTIVYAVTHPPQEGDPAVDIRLIGIDGSGQRVLCHEILMPIQWFPDGSRFLCLHALVNQPPGFEGDMQIASVSIADGSIQPIKKWTGDILSTTVRLSPDARYVAYELTSSAASAKRDIFAIEIDSKRETPLVVHETDDRLLGWARDGRSILFASDRMGPWSVWLLPVAKGQAQGVPAEVTRTMGEIAPVGFGENGAFYYRVGRGTGGIYTARIDTATGQLLSAPTVETTGVSADWSPDGKYMAISSWPAERTSTKPHVIRIRSLATRQERELPNKLSDFCSLRWSPDGRSLLASNFVDFVGTKPEDDLGGRVYHFDAATGETGILLDQNKWLVRMAELSPNGKTLYYSTADIIRRQIDSGHETTIFTCPQPRGYAPWALSPNGEFVAVGCNEDCPKAGVGGVKRVLVIPSEGGQAKELLRWDEPIGDILDVCWSRDAKSVLMRLHKERGVTLKHLDEFWQVPTDGGQARKIMEMGSTTARSYCLRIHPDGQRIAFHGGDHRQELWAMENVLPEAGAPASPK